MASTNSTMTAAAVADCPALSPADAAAHQAASHVRTAVAGMSSTAAPAAAITPAVERLLGKFASWLDKPWKTATQINADNLLAVLRIHARFMHGCRTLGNEVTASRLQRDYGNRANWNQLHDAYQYAEAVADLAWAAAMADADRAFTVLTGMNPTTAPLGRLLENAELLTIARRSTVEVAA
ncbi:hypothetical protein [Streptomyces sp. NBC_00932]|uniref:hypothetical protein n=1 Tax=Streptomyces sp. NBC_00932 TaxID=2903690 RepID=UPI003869A09B|nr:hypothetical protein OG221_27685 [Streptomyces sp. NBC_00932]